MSRPRIVAADEGGVGIREFRSREPKREPRRYRTSRNVQFNVKAAQQTVDRFYQVCDRTGWWWRKRWSAHWLRLEREFTAAKQM